jgi:hypothetical protein
VRGLLPTRVIFAEPRLEHTIVDRLKHDDCRCELRFRFLRGLSEAGRVPADVTGMARERWLDEQIERVTL